MAKLPKVPPHHIEATGKAKMLRIDKSSGPLTVDNKPKDNGTITIHPYHGKNSGR